MTNQTTRRRECNRNQSTLFAAFELGSSEWKLAFSVGLGQKPRRRTVPAGDLKKLAAEFDGAKKRFDLDESCKVLTCYEAGRDGFWIHRHLTEAGVENLVVDSSSIEVNRKARRAKADGLDVEKLLTMLIRYHHGEHKVWSVLRVPSVEEEDRRQLHRELQTLKKERSRTTNRIRGLLASQGIRLDAEVDLRTEQLEAIRLWDGSPLPPGLRDRVGREWAHLVFLRDQVRSLESQRRSALRKSAEPDLAKVEQLSKLRAIGDGSAWLLVREFFGWRTFKNRRALASLSGLTPTPFQSGEMRREQGISKAGNRYVRGIAVELAWSWLRYQPDSKLSLWYQERFASGGSRARKVGIVAMARRLLIELWRFLETGSVPEGARLKA